MNKIILFIVAATMLLILNGCSKNPSPQFRVKNSQPIKVNITVQTSKNKVIKIDEVVFEQTTQYQDIPEGNLTVTSVTQNESVSFLAEKNTKYTIVISAEKPPVVLTDK